MVTATFFIGAILVVANWFLLALLTTKSPIFLSDDIYVISLAVLGVGHVLWAWSEFRAAEPKWPSLRFVIGTALIVAWGWLEPLEGFQATLGFFFVGAAFVLGFSRKAIRDGSFYMRGRNSLSGAGLLWGFVAYYTFELFMHYNLSGEPGLLLRAGILGLVGALAGIFGDYLALAAACWALFSTVAYQDLLVLVIIAPLVAFALFFALNLIKLFCGADTSDYRRAKTDP